MSNQELYQQFSSVFNYSDTPHLFFAPGRINLIGEHTDYNGGHVFPAAISFGTYALTAKRNDQKIRFYSVNIPDMGIIECTLDDLDYKKEHSWANYPKGMIQFIRQNGFPIDSGMDILFYGNIPNSAGLSSSASIEMVTGVALEGLFEFDMDRLKLVKIGQKVENDYIGVNSGIMDQFATGLGKKNHAIHLDTNTLDYTYAPIALPKHSIIIINTNKSRTLADSKYNERRNECEQAVKDLQTELNITNLCELDPSTFEKHKTLIENSTTQKRARHIVYENDRTLKALNKLKNDDLAGFGKLMNESHQSLQQDYEVTGLELDTIVESAWEQDGVIGARMTGAGFGGCAIAIVENEQLDTFKQNVGQDYVDKIGYDVTFYTPSIADGAKEMTKEVQ